MELLKAKVEEGSLRGIPLDPLRNKELTDQLFSDKIGLFLKMGEETFAAAMEVISVYERISRAKLNLEKSIIIQLDYSPLLAWVAGMGFRVAHPSEMIPYLGYPMVVWILSKQEAEFLVNKPRMHVRHWSNRLLSLQGQLVLVCHVLRAMPIYNLMALSLKQDGFKRLEESIMIFFAA